MLCLREGCNVIVFVVDTQSPETLLVAKKVSVGNSRTGLRGWEGGRASSTMVPMHRIASTTRHFRRSCTSSWMTPNSESCPSLSW